MSSNLRPSTDRGPGFIERIKIHGESEFTASCPFPFLVAADLLPSRVARLSDLADKTPTSVMKNGPIAMQVKRSELSQRTIPVRKNQDYYPDMITVGRTSNHDVVIQSDLVSRFHAFFRVRNEIVELTDVGSQNGTFVDDCRLDPASPPRPIQSGQRIRFADVAFFFLTASELWREIRRLDRAHQLASGF